MSALQLFNNSMIQLSANKKALAAHAPNASIILPEKN
jgi:hypothetical protein